VSDEIEYIEPTQEHVGQVVEVRQAEMATHRQRKLLAVLPHPIKYRFVCQDSVDAVSSSHWQFARIARPLTYAERQAKCGLKVGDRVRIVREFTDYEQGYTNTFDESMKCRIGTIQTIDRLTDWGIRFVRIGFAWPYFVLEKVEDRVATRDDIGKQVYINGAFGDIFTIDVIYGIEGDVWRAVIRSGDNRLVYELSNLRVKE
jgi:hypothetical protein